MSNLQQKLSMAVRRLTGKAYLNESDVELMLKEIRVSFLEADVNIGVMREFLAKVKEQALGEKIMKGLNPGDQVVKVVKDELTRVLGQDVRELKLKEKGITVIMMMGLQGSGKTTSIAKIGKYISEKKSKKVLLIAGDIYRPGAISQLVTLGQTAKIDVFQNGNTDIKKIVKTGLDKAKSENYEVVIIDTAGRLSIDKDMMDELKTIKSISSPDEIILTVDSLTGQDAANVAKSFHEQIGATAAVLTKLDGDNRGGAALSISQVAGIPIIFSCNGEKLEDIELFHPDRYASRILDMGDVESLIEEAQDKIDEKESEKIMTKMLDGTFNYNDLYKQFKMIKKMGSISKILGFLPGLGNLKNAEGFDDSKLDKMKTILDSMTNAEKEDPSLIEWSSSRRNRIAKGAGVLSKDVYNLIESLAAQKKVFKKLGKMDESEIQKISEDPKSLYTRQEQVNNYKGKGKNKGRRW